MSKKVIWAKHTWDLSRFEHRVDAPAGYIFDVATVVEEKKIIEVVLSAYSSDPIWKSMIDDIAERMSSRIQTTLGRTGARNI